MKIAVFFCLFVLAHAKHRGNFAFGASGLGSNLGYNGNLGVGLGSNLGYNGNLGVGLGSNLGYNGNLGVGFGTNLFRRRYGFGWQRYSPKYYSGYAGLGAYGANSGYSGPGVPIVNTVANSPYNSGFNGNRVYGSSGSLGSPAYRGYGYSGNGYVYQ